MTRTTDRLALVLCIAAVGFLPTRAPSGTAVAADDAVSKRDAGKTADETIERRLARWKKMSEEDRATMRRALARYQAMSPKKQEELRRRYRWFKSLPEAERQLVRSNFELVTAASKEELKALKALYKRYLQVPANQQEKARRFYHGWRQRSVEDRRAFLREIRKTDTIEQLDRIARRWLKRTRPTSQPTTRPTSQPATRPTTQRAG